MAPGAGDARSTEASNPTCHSTFTTSSHSQTQTCEPIQQTSSYSASPATTSCIPEPIQQASFFRKREIPAHLLEFFEPAEIGLEPTPDEYVAEMVAVFREVRRVLRDDGTLWLNIGDSYSTHAAGKVADPMAKSTLAGVRNATVANRAASQRSDAEKRGGIPEKNLLGIPWLLAFALRADGWFLRSDIIWHKPNPMPESVRDRPTSAHEHVFLLTKAQRYFYDAGAIAEDFADERQGMPGSPSPKSANIPGQSAHTIGFKAWDSTGKNGRNARNVWTIATQPYSGAHFATMPPGLAERCIKAGTKPGDTVLDPFGGAGTTGLVADRLNRNAVLVELNPEYRALAQERITDDAPLLARSA